MLLDTASMYFRAFFGVPEIKAPNGTPVNAVRGLLDFITRLVGEYQPDHLVCCWDNDWRPQWRVDLLPSYKAHRVVVRPARRRAGRRGGARPARDAGAGHPRRCSTRSASRRRRRRLRGRRRDRHPRHRRRPCRSTSSPATATCSSSSTTTPSVRVLYIARGVGRHERVDRTTGSGRSTASRPRQYADFATLRGDASDGLPGVAGVGDKTAATLLSGSATCAGILRRRRRPRLRPGARPARQDQGTPPTTSRSRRRWWPSPATSTSAAPTPRSPASPPTPTCSPRSARSSASPAGRAAHRDPGRRPWLSVLAAGSYAWRHEQQSPSSGATAQIARLLHPTAARGRPPAGRRWSAATDQRDALEATAPRPGCSTSRQADGRGRSRPRSRAATRSSSPPAAARTATSSASAPSTSRAR